MFLSLPQEIFVPMNPDLLYRIALTQVPNIGDVQTKTLLQHYPTAEAIFKARKRALEKIEGIGTIRARSIKNFTDFSRAETEIKFIEQYGIQPLYLTDCDYPQRLLNCYDSPALLYYRGTTNLNASRILAVVGTRNHSDYGRWACEQMIEALQGEDILIVSGLAFGIDTLAHRAAIKHNMNTVGVLAHGLDMLYPHQNKSLAKQMTAQGGLLTDFPSNSKPDKQNFPKRNRIVAGMCDCILVIESGKKGGSLITAELGNGYNKDVFALPGRTNDPKSEGCNFLISNNKAALVQDAKQLLELMGWKETQKRKAPAQRELFIELSPEERSIVQLLQEKNGITLDELYFKSGLSSSKVAQALLMLEMQGLVTALPGKVYQLN